MNHPVLNKNARYFYSKPIFISPLAGYTNVDMGNRFFLGILVFVLVALSLAAEGGDIKTKDGWFFSQSVAGQVNPPGLSIDSRVFYVWPLYREKRGILWDTSRVEAGLYNSLTPAFDTLSAFVRVEPVAFFDLSASAGLRGYYDAFGYGFTPRGDYDSSWASRDRKDAERDAAAGFRYSAAATLKGALGPLVFASATTYTVYDMFHAPGNASYYYDPSADTNLKNFDGFLTNDSLVLYTITEGDLLLRAGFLHTFLYVPFSDYVSRRLCLLCRIEGDLSPSLRLFAAVLGGAFLQDRYYSWKDGKIYAAVQAGIKVKLE
jgi:hypothetical protein